MISVKSTLLALACVASAVTAESGSLTGYLSIESVNNMMGTFVPLIAYYALQNKTVPTKIHKVGVGYTIDLQDIHLDSVSGFDTKSMEFINGTNQVKVTLSNIQVNGRVDGTIYALWCIPMRASYFNISGFDLELTLGVDSNADKVHYKIVEASKLSFKDFTLKTNSKFLDGLLNLIHKTLIKIVNDLLPKAAAAISNAVTKFNS